MTIFETLPRTALASGTITIPQAESDRLATVLGSEPPASGRLHPLYGYIAAQRGIGVRIPELCALAEFDIDDGPMLGSLEVTIAGELEAGTEYAVDGEVLGIERKHGRTIGTFDVMTFRERLVAADGAVVATSRVSFVLPRKGPAK